MIDNVYMIAIVLLFVSCSFRASDMAVSASVVVSSRLLHSMRLQKFCAQIKINDAVCSLEQA